jgi:hypothetical protein
MDDGTDLHHRPEESTRRQTTSPAGSPGAGPE